MDTDAYNALTLKEFYIVKSKETGKPYISEQREAFLFEILRDATPFIEKNPDLYVDDRPQMIKKDVFTSGFYSEGIRCINMMNPKTKKTTQVAISKEECKVQYYNEELNADILLLKETKKKKYLREMHDKHFLLPVEIRARTPKVYPSIHYVYTLHTDNVTRYYFLFSTIQEFDEWNKEGKFSPLDVDIKTLRAIVVNTFNVNVNYKANKLFPEWKDIQKPQTNGVIINPLSDRLLLDYSLLGHIFAGTKKKSSSPEGIKK